MKRYLLFWMLGILLGLSIGCTTKKAATRDHRAAYAIGLQSGRIEQRQHRPGEAEETSITFSGAVKNAAIPWREELSLSQAIVEAGHSARRNPRTIFVHRGSDVFQVPTWRLLHGEDFQIEPGDHIEIRQ